MTVNHNVSLKKNSVANLSREDREDEYKMAKSSLLKFADDMGSYVDLCQNCDLWPMHLAVEFGDIGMLSALVNLGFDVDEQNDDGESALHTAVRYGNEKAVKMLLMSGEANCNLIDGNGDTPMDIAAVKNSYSIMLELIRSEHQHIVTINPDSFHKLVDRISDGSFKQFEELVSSKINSEISELISEGMLMNADMIRRLQEFHQIMSEKRKQAVQQRETDSDISVVKPKQRFAERKIDLNQTDLVISESDKSQPSTSPELVNAKTFIQQHATGFLPK